jgi:hypothetical protein
MIIYSVLRECSYDGPHLVLFTSLKKAINYCKSEYEAYGIEFGGENNQLVDEMEINYQQIKADIKSINEHYSWCNSVHNGESFSLTIERHDSNAAIWFNEQHGGF